MYKFFYLEEIDTSSASRCVNWIISSNCESLQNSIKFPDNPLIFMINSCGGYISSAVSIIHAMTSSHMPIWTVGSGQCSSSATFVLAAGDKRYCYPNTRAEVHESGVDLAGDLKMSELDERVQSLKLSSQHLSNELTLLNINEETLRILNGEDGDKILEPLEMKELGIIDEIVVDRKDFFYKRIMKPVAFDRNLDCEEKMRIAIFGEDEENDQKD